MQPINDPTIAQLGPLQRTYRPNTASTMTMIVLISLFLGGFGIVIDYLAFGGASDTASSNVLGEALIGTAALALVIAYDVYAVRALQRTVNVHQNGIVVLQGKQAQVYPWDQVASVTQSITKRYTNGIYTGTTYTYRLHMLDGRKVNFSSMIKGIADLGQTIQSAVTAVLYPRAIAAVQAGQTISFGTLSLNQQGIGKNGSLLPWNEIASMTLNKGYITIRKRDQRIGSWANIAVASMPNVFIFLAVSEQLRKAAGVRG